MGDQSDAITVSDNPEAGRYEARIGGVVAGFADVAVPVSFWQSLFITGHGFWSDLENVVLGPFLAIISFVCSIGNVPLAAALIAVDSGHPFDVGILHALAEEAPAGGREW